MQKSNVTDPEKNGSFIVLLGKMRRMTVPEKVAQKLELREGDLIEIKVLRVIRPGEDDRIPGGE